MDKISEGKMYPEDKTVLFDLCMKWGYPLILETMADLLEDECAGTPDEEESDSERHYLSVDLRSLAEKNKDNPGVGAL